MDYEVELRKKTVKISDIKNEIAVIKGLIREEIDSAKNRVTELQKMLETY